MQRNPSSRRPPVQRPMLQPRSSKVFKPTPRKLPKQQIRRSQPR